MSTPTFGLNAETFKPLGGWDHVQQSINDILTTSLGERVYRRDYGSRIPELIDKPMTQETILDLYVATYEALDKWEPRFHMERIEFIEGRPDGQAFLECTGIYFPRGHLGDYTQAFPRSVAVMYT